MSSINYLYGLPIYTGKINKEKYQKNKILSQIEENYKISNVRSNWDKNSYIKTDIHHSNLDTKNEKFININYYDLTEKYKIIINDFFKKINFNNDFNYKYEIVNYTCSNTNSFMAPHIHKDCSFSLVHYVSFDKTQHIATIFKNPYYFNSLLPNEEKLRNLFARDQMEHSWLCKEWVFDTEEDDIVIFPGVLEHYIRSFDSKKLRITIVVNITIE
jgi:hypothetical protein